MGPQGNRTDRIVAETRAAIIEAFSRLTHTSNSATVSIPAVAAEAGVSVRTVYRYFPSKDDLQNAAAYQLANEVLGDDLFEHTTIDTLEDTLAAMWRHFADRLPAVLAEHTTPAGRALRAQRLDDGRTLIRQRIDQALDDEIVDLLIAISSSSMFLELVDRMGHAPEHAAAMVTRLAKLVLADALDPTPRTTGEDDD